MSLGLGLEACPLCFYQRAFVMAVAGLLFVALLTSARTSVLPSLLALPAAVAGLGVAVFHVSLEASGKLECPGGVFGWGTAPQQSLAMFVLLVIVLTVAACRGRRVAAVSPAAISAAAVVGLLFAVGAIASAPPLPPPPAAPYDEPLTICRPPYRAL